MTSIDPNPHLAKARAAITEILSALERDTGQLVESLSLETIDVTSIGEPQKVLMDVRITMMRVVGHQW